MKILKRTIWLCILSLAWPMASFGSAATIPRIFILHSYESGHVCGQPQHDGFISALRSAGYDHVAIDTYLLYGHQTNQ